MISISILLDCLVDAFVIRLWHRPNLFSDMFHKIVLFSFYDSQSKSTKIITKFFFVFLRLAHTRHGPHGICIWQTTLAKNQKKKKTKRKTSETNYEWLNVTNNWIRLRWWIEWKSQRQENKRSNHNWGKWNEQKLQQRRHIQNPTKYNV